MTLHPAGKHGVNISRDKYTQVKTVILTIISSHGELTFKELLRLGKIELSGKFDGSIPWYLTTVKLDLEARGMIRRSGVPQRLRLSES
jgi:hypothetical protein